MDFIRVGMVTDSDLLATGVVAALRGAPDIVWLGADADLERLAPLRPDVLLADEVWTHQAGEIFARPAKLILIGLPASRRWIADRIDSGVHGYLHRGDDLSLMLQTAIRTVMRGEKYLSPSALTEYLSVNRNRNRFVLLDTEARSVLRMLCEGYSVKDISQALHVPPRRVYAVREKLRRRFGAATNEHLIRRAFEEGDCNPF